MLQDSTHHLACFDCMKESPCDVSLQLAGGIVSLTSRPIISAARCKNSIVLEDNPLIVILDKCFNSIWEASISGCTRLIWWLSSVHWSLNRLKMRISGLVDSTWHKLKESERKTSNIW